MVTDSTSLSPSTPSWFTPKRLLVIFCLINLITYVDRGTIASNGVNGSQGTCTANGTCTEGSGIQGDFKLTDFEDGCLSSAFMVGLLIASPTFAELAKRINPFRLIGVGLSVWTVAVIGCGISFNFWSILMCRMLVGVGEASFVSLAAPFIDDNAPATQKTAWLGIFYMCITVGYALGYIYGGLIGSYFNWRIAFFGVAILMLPFAVLGFFIHPLKLKGFEHAESKRALLSIDAVSEVQATEALAANDRTLAGKEENKDASFESSSKLKSAFCNLNIFSAFLKDLKVLLAEKIYVVNVLGACAYTFVIGAYSYWGPKAGKSIYNLNNADYVFGGMTIVSGVFGTLAGGYALDSMTSTIPNSFKLLSATTFVGAVFCFSAFCFSSLYPFLVLFAIGEVLVFATQGPVNFTILQCVKPSLRPLSMAMSTVSIHIFGDVPSPPLVGVLQDYLNNWRESALILTAIFFLASGIWFVGIFLPSVDRFYEENEHQVVGADSSIRTPLLEEKIARSPENPAQP